MWKFLKNLFEAIIIFTEQFFSYPILPFFGINDTKELKEKLLNISDFHLYISEYIEQYRRISPNTLVDLDNIDLFNKDLSYFNFSKCSFKNSKLKLDIIRLVNFSDSDLRSVDFESSDLSKSKLNNANLNNANFEEADLSQAKLNNANLQGSDLSESNLSGANLSGANLKNADFTKATISNSTYFDEEKEIYKHQLFETKGIKSIITDSSYIENLIKEIIDIRAVMPLGTVSREFRDILLKNKKPENLMQVIKLRSDNKYIGIPEDIMNIIIDFTITQETRENYINYVKYREQEITKSNIKNIIEY